MSPVTARLREDHRILEERLDALWVAIGSGGEVVERLRAAAEGNHAHYQREQPFLDRLAAYEPAVARKLKAQHEEASEMAVQFEEALTALQTRDMLSLARRFHAIAQHNIIEEERDVFPLADRCFSDPEQQELQALLASQPAIPL